MVAEVLDEITATEDQFFTASDLDALRAVKEAASPENQNREGEAVDDNA